MRLLSLAALGNLAILSYCFSIEDWRLHISPILISFAVLSGIYLYLINSYFNRTGKTLIRHILLWALILRAVTLFLSYQQPSALSADLNRYLWEGKVVAAGYNPYLLAPSSEQLISIQDANPTLYSNVDHKQIPALYPPLTQLFFASINGSEAIYRLVLFVAELIVLGTLVVWIRERNLPEGRLILYAFCPLPIIEIAIGAHLDALMIPAIISGLYLAQKAMREKDRENDSNLFLWIWSIVLLTLASLIKQTAIIPLGVVVYRFVFGSNISLGKRFSFLVIPLTIVILCYLPFVASGQIFGSLSKFTHSWRFNGHLFYLIEWLLGLIPIMDSSSSGKILIAFSLLVFAFFRRKSEPHSLIAGLLFAVFVLSPIRYPWYSLCFIVLTPVLSSQVTIQLYIFTALLSLISYKVWMHPEIWEIGPLLGALQYLPLSLYLLYRGLYGTKFLPSSKVELNSLHTSSGTTLNL